MKCTRLNATLQRSNFRNNTERSGTITFPCERGLGCLYTDVLSKEPVMSEF